MSAPAKLYSFSERQLEEAFEEWIARSKDNAEHITDGAKAARQLLALVAELHHTERELAASRQQTAMIDTSGSAFPREDYQGDEAPGQRGLTKRELFAAMAMQSCSDKAWRRDGVYETVRFAVGVADALLAELAK